MRLRLAHALLTIVCAAGMVPAARAQESGPAKPPVLATLVSTRTAVAPFEPLALKLTLANESPSASITIARSELVTPRSFVAASYDRKGHWVVIDGEAPQGSVELKPGESWTMPVAAMLPEALTKTPSPITLQWVGNGALAGIRSTEATVTVRDDKNPVATLETSEGTIVIELLPEKAPNHVANFITLAKSGFYDRRLFHRVIPGFMVQTGCPLGTGLGDPGYKIAAEFNDTSFVKCVVGMARTGDNVNSAGSQFFVCVADGKSLDNQYTAFGRVLEGQDVADKISNVPRDVKNNDRPFKDVILKKVTVAIPAAYQLPEVKKV
jgi:peptidyl-prolyl cis-trans isomerase B (cyclophilin B)